MVVNQLNEKTSHISYAKKGTEGKRTGPCNWADKGKDKNYEFPNSRYIHMRFER